MTKRLLRDLVIVIIVSTITSNELMGQFYLNWGCQHEIGDTPELSVCELQAINIIWGTELPNCYVGDEYVKVLDFDFNGGALDTDFWSYRTNWTNASNPDVLIAGNGEEHEFVFDNTINENILRLTSSEGSFYDCEVPWCPTQPVDCNNPNCILDNGLLNYREFNYRMGEISSRYKFKYGAFEMRAKIPCNDCTWPAFWLFGGWPNDGTDDQGCGQEIDILEFFCGSGDENCNGTDHAQTLKLKTNVHRWHPFPTCSETMPVPKIIKYLNIGQTDDHFQCGCDFLLPNQQRFCDDYHVYGMKWDNYSIKWYLDDVLVREMPRYLSQSLQFLNPCNIPVGTPINMQASFPLSTPMHIIVGNQLGGVDDNNPMYCVPPNGLGDPVFDIDFIRVYKPIYCESVTTSQAEISPNDSEWNFIYGNDVNLISGYEIEDGEQMAIVAAEQITIGPGVNISSGSNFTTTINPDACEAFRGSETSNEQISSIQSMKGDSDQTQSESSGLNLVEHEELTMYPNPANESINVSIHNPMNAHRFSILDFSGKLLFESKSIPNSSFVIDTSDLKSGSYILRLELADYVVNERFIISR